MGHTINNDDLQLVISALNLAIVSVSISEEDCKITVVQQKESISDNRL